jgi:chemotaxis signal transduction protein
MKRAEAPRADRAGFDWEAIKRRLPAALLEETPEQLAREFQNRAEALARVPSDDARSAGTPHLEIGAGGVRFAIAQGSVRSIVSPHRVTRLPGAPEALAQVIHADGRLVALLDLAVLFKLEARASVAAAPNVVLLDTAGSPLGLCAEQVHGFRAIEIARLSHPRGNGPGADVLRGITADMTLVISVAQLIAGLRNAARGAQPQGSVP